MNAIVRENQLPKLPGAIVESIAFLYDGNIVFIPQIFERFQPFLYWCVVSASFVQQGNQSGILQEVESVAQSAVAGIVSGSCVVAREHCERRMHLCSSLSTATLHSRPIYHVDVRRAIMEVICSCLLSQNHRFCKKEKDTSLFMFPLNYVQVWDNSDEMK